jgi:hypothetical protein
VAALVELLLGQAAVGERVAQPFQCRVPVRIGRPGEGRQLLALWFRTLLGGFVLLARMTTLRGRLLTALCCLAAGA